MSSSSSSSSRQPGVGLSLSMMVILVMVTMGLLYVAVQATRPTAEPPRYELVSQSIPLAKQTVILLDVQADPAFYELMEGELQYTFTSLKPDERVCILPVGPDVPLIRYTPWCSEPFRTTWWKLPDAPAADAPANIQEAYALAEPKLLAELQANETRALANWEAKQLTLVQETKQLLWQQAVPQYQDIKGSLEVLVNFARRTTISTPTDVVIYSWMQEALYADSLASRQELGKAPKELRDTTIQVNLFSATGGQELAGRQAEWNPWFQTANPQSVTWRVINITSLTQVLPAHPMDASSGPRHLLPPVVSKPVFPDATSVVNGSDRPLETNITEGLQE